MCTHTRCPSPLESWPLNIYQQPLAHPSHTLHVHHGAPVHILHSGPRWWHFHRLKHCWLLWGVWGKRAWQRLCLEVAQATSVHIPFTEASHLAMPTFKWGESHYVSRMKKGRTTTAHWMFTCLLSAPLPGLNVTYMKKSCLAHCHIPVTQTPWRCSMNTEWIWEETSPKGKGSGSKPPWTNGECHHFIFSPNLVNNVF